MKKDIVENIVVSCSISRGELDKVKSWLIPSLAKQNGIQTISLYLVNYTGEGTIYDGKKNIGKVNVEEICAKKQLGFGEAHNYTFEIVKPEEFFVVINPDVYLDEDCFLNLMDKFRSEKRIGIVEARQMPHEHPKEYDKETLETPWASGFLMLIASDFFAKAGGFDERFWMYCEDVDLSWNAWISGYKVIYQKEAVASHYTGLSEYSNTRYYIENFWTARNFLYISRKYFGLVGYIKARILLRSSGYPLNFIKEVESSYERLFSNNKKYINDFYRKNKKKISDCQKIKINGFNQYHNIRNN